ncbi:crossover junction endodeoxyribonuclease RuvC [Candidatus Bandiella euplotis]|nr:crossover junction endodeoxyribonuclease RuvC [Candidatus Bandiella woodruffii]
MGIDPGLNFTGWGVIEHKGADKFVYIASGVIKTSLKTPYPERLHQLFSKIMDVVNIHTPDAAAIEDTYININNQSSIKLAQAKAAAIIAISHHKIPLVDYPAKKVKKTITGSGSADKTQVIKMIKYWLPEVTTEISDEADALAIALCYASHYKQKGE